jgi:hypothetical protein
MVKKTVIAIVAVVLLVAVFASASYRYGGYMPYRYFYYPETAFPSYVTYPPYSYYQPPSVAYPYSFLNEQSFNRYGVPLKTYPTYTGVTPLQQAGMLCGNVGSSTFECDYGLFCDYSGSIQKNVGVCRWQ